ncbi:hypothetical protein D9Q98_003964 [Chlorella vulgaris]|uniref:Patatin n=1 Tax=Chlorella vulgaris TaxID=3077 RepID=A0A9D4TR06_CHLVU|nr:hypothetical protein D9Q98_003964 [Chlorella vulgaris]
MNVVLSKTQTSAKRFPAAAMGAAASKNTEPLTAEARFANFVKEEGIEALAAHARSFREGVAENDNPIIISDAISRAPDGSTIQWVQLVLAGGGVLGIAHVGFVYVLEEAGIRFLGMGGTSAGAINVGLIAAVRSDPAAVSWEETLKILASTEFKNFEDGNPYFVELRKSLVSKDGSVKKDISFFGKVGLASKALLNANAIKGAWDAMGAHPAETFRTWLTGHFVRYGVKTQEDLAAKMKLQLDTNAIYRRKDDAAPYDVAARFEDKCADRLAESQLGQQQPLKLVTAELRTQSKIVWPEDAELFYADPKTVNPTDYVRSSMSVPGFFQPFRLGQAKGVGVALPNAGKTEDDNWKARVNFHGPVPHNAVFVDGGTLSNFPIALFHNLTRKPLLPTLGVQLGVDRTELQEIKSVPDLIGSMYNSSRLLLDRDFIERNPDYSQLVASVDTTGFGFLDFELSPERQQELFKRGMKAAVDFLEGWRAGGNKWENYKQLRQDMVTMGKRKPA